MSNASQVDTSSSAERMRAILAMRRAAAQGQSADQQSLHSSDSGANRDWTSETGGVRIRQLSNTPFSRDIRALRHEKSYGHFF